jgi:hypothetical protein
VSRRWALLQRVRAVDVDNPTEDYMVRWRLIQTPCFGIYLHRINTPDRRSTLHDHPWPFVTIVLRGGYTEDHGVRPAGRGPVYEREERSWPARSVHYMRPDKAHTITALHRSPTWTLVFAGRREPEPSWGYADETGWTPFNEHPHGAEFLGAQAARDGRGS